MATTDEAKTLTPKLRFSEFTEPWFPSVLSDLATLINERVPVGQLTVASYVSTENLLPDFAGKTDASSLPSVATATRFAPGDVLVSNIRPYLRKVWQADHNGGASNDVLVLRPKRDHIKGYLAGVLRCDAFIDYMMRGAKGVKMPRGDIAAILAYPVPHPPEAEQRKIAECLTSLDDLIAAEGRRLEALRAQKKGLMQNLFPREGETTPRIRFPEFRYAGEWVEKKLDDCLHLQDGFAFKSTDFVTEQLDATQVIRITDINNRNSNNDKVYIPNVFLDHNKLRKYCVNDGDLLLSLTGAAGFNFFFWNGGPATINQRTAKVTARSKSDNGMLRLLEPLIHHKINARGEGQNNNLSKEFLSTIVLLIPEPLEQQRIASCLSSLDALITAQSQRLDALRTHKKGLMQSVFPTSAQRVAIDRN